MSSERERNPDEVFCRHCGEAIKVRAEVCPHCGVRNEQYNRSMGGTIDSTDRFGRPSNSTTRTTGGTGLESNVAAALSYVLGFVSGIVLYLIEDDDRFVRFHAAQSIAVFGGLAVADLVASVAFVAVGLDPIAGLLNGLLSLVTIGLWAFLILTAYQGKTNRIPVAADVADELVSSSGGASRTPSSSRSVGTEKDTAETDALAALRERYARGEIGEAEFERRLERLLESEGVEGNHWREPAETERSR
ncbi:SHOCT domain-containing protein [Halococcus agarilyticus]|uniref:SHOCT domain-containing protein n=1 Tax=Halococcus agarilyticus TaxID=1232219 RepID=UPI00067765CF|nr:SHOCT domain-containing protein [Halococcus agarilyticus]